MNVLLILKWFVAAIMEKCDPGTARKVADSVLDKVEEYFKKTRNPFDDLLIPAIKKCIREPFGITDSDDVKQPAGETTTLEDGGRNVE